MYHDPSEDGGSGPPPRLYLQYLSTLGRALGKWYQCSYVTHVYGGFHQSNSGEGTMVRTTSSKETEKMGIAVGDSAVKIEPLWGQWPATGMLVCWVGGAAWPCIQIHGRPCKICVGHMMSTAMVPPPAGCHFKQQGSRPYLGCVIWVPADRSIVGIVLNVVVSSWKGQFRHGEAFCGYGWH